MHTFFMFPNSSDSSLSDAEPSNEMLHLISNFKAKRDELKRDVDGWLAGECHLHEDLEKSLDELSLLKTSTPVGPICRMMSIDLMSSTTDVDSLDEHMMSGSEVKAIQEVDEDKYSEQENSLIGYEDKKEGNKIFTPHHGPSFGLLEDIPCSQLVLSLPSQMPSLTPFPILTNRHLSREWSSLAKATPQGASSQHAPEEVDRFFECLEDVGDLPPIPAAAPPEAMSPFT